MSWRQHGARRPVLWRAFQSSTNGLRVNRAESRVVQSSTGEYRVQKYSDLWFCQDCTIAECNGDYTGMDDQTEAAVTAGFAVLGEAYSHLSENGDSETGEGIREFSRGSCDCCGTGFSGHRHRFAGWEK